MIPGTNVTRAHTRRIVVYYHELVSLARTIFRKDPLVSGEMRKVDSRRFTVDCRLVCTLRTLYHRRMEVTGLRPSPAGSYSVPPLRGGLLPPRRLHFSAPRNRCPNGIALDSNRSRNGFLSDLFITCMYIRKYLLTSNYFFFFYWT